MRNNKLAIMSTDDILASVDNFLKLIGNLEDDYRELKAEYDKCNDLQSDIVHEIESDKFNVVAGYKKLKELKDLRFYRRQVSNKLKVLEPLYIYVQRHKNVNTDYFKVFRDMKNYKEEQDNWHYNKRCPRGIEALNPKEIVTFVDEEKEKALDEKYTKTLAESKTGGE